MRKKQWVCPRCKTVRETIPHITGAICPKCGYPMERDR